MNTESRMSLVEIAEAARAERIRVATEKGVFPPVIHDDGFVECYGCYVANNRHMPPVHPDDIIVDPITGDTYCTRCAAVGANGVAIYRAGDPIDFGLIPTL